MQLFYETTNIRYRTYEVKIQIKYMKNYEAFNFRVCSIIPYTERQKEREESDSVAADRQAAERFQTDSSI